MTNANIIHTPEFLNTISNSNLLIDTRIIIDGIGFIAWDKGAEFTEIGLYEFNEEKFNKIVQNC